MAKTIKKYYRKTDSAMNRRRQRLRDAGLCVVSVWVKPEDKESAKAFCQADTVRINEREDN